jgi:N-ethylmaleimide reductase
VAEKYRERAFSSQGHIPMSALTRRDESSPVVHTDLFEPVQLGACLLANRIVMAPLTRSRARADGTPTPLMAEYYAQRASAGLIIAEGTNMSPRARGYALTPGVYTDSQIEGWQCVTQAIHAKRGHAYLQLWHVGRISHPSLQPGGALPIAPSAICPQATSFTEVGFQPCVTPRALETAEIPELVQEYRRAAAMPSRPASTASRFTPPTAT